MPKDKKKKKKNESKRDNERPVEEAVVQPAKGNLVWTEVIALQGLTRKLEYEVINRYMTRPDRFRQLQELYVAAFERLLKDDMNGCRGGCPAGYYCCKDVCQPEPCGIQPNPTPGTKE
jgi:hypothetical protein